MPGRFSDEARVKVLEAVRAGVHPQVACVAAGMSQSFYKQVRYRARNGDVEAQELVEAIETAEAKAEVTDVEATQRAVQPFADHEVVCPHCDEPFSADPEQLAAIVGKYESFQKAKGLAAEVAIKKLERRHPKRWSQKVIHTVQEEHERLLNVCQRVLEPEVFEALLEEYLSEGEGEGEASDSSGGASTGGVH